MLTPEQQVEIEKFRKQATDTSKQLKELRKNLRVDTDRLELVTKVINIGAIPLLVAILGITLALRRRAQVRKAVSA